MDSQDSEDSLLEDKGVADQTSSPDRKSQNSDDSLLGEHSAADDNELIYITLHDSDESLIGTDNNEGIHRTALHDSDESLIGAADNGLIYKTSQHESDESLIGTGDSKAGSDHGYLENVKSTFDQYPVEHEKNVLDDTKTNAEYHLQVTKPDGEADSTWSEETFVTSGILDNPAYTDSLSSNDSKKALLGPSYQSNLHCINLHDPANLKDPGYDTDPDIEVIRDRSNTISHLAESTAFIDTIGYPTPDHTRLSHACRNAVLTLSQDIFQKYASTQLLPKEQDAEKQTTIEEDVEDLTYVTRHKKNLIFLSISITLMYTAIGSLRNLQSSMNHENGIGLYSLAASYGAFMLFSLFTPFVVQKFKPKKCLLFSLVPHLLYVIANLYPTFYIFIPASFLQGLSNALLWNAMSTYTTYLARARALQKDEKTVHIASRYFGIFFFFYQFSIVIGNLISSLVLLYGSDVDGQDGLLSTTSMPESAGHLEVNSSYGILHDSNRINSLSMSMDTHFSLCGARYCHSFKIDHAGMTVNPETKYTLLGIYGMCVIFSIVVVAYLLDPVKTYRATSTDCKLIFKHVLSVLGCLIDKRFLLLSVLFMYTCMQMGFAMAEITKAYVTCPVGIYMVGYTMICFGVCGGISSYISGRLDKHIGRIALITAACALDLGLLLIMSLWQPQPEQTYAYFLLLGGWGIGDGILISQTNSIISAIFPDKLEEAFAAYRVAQGLGLTISFMYAESLCMTYKMYILAGTAIFGTVLYIILEIMLRHSKKVSDKNGIDQELEI